MQQFIEHLLCARCGVGDILYSCPLTHTWWGWLGCFQDTLCHQKRNTDNLKNPSREQHVLVNKGDLQCQSGSLKLFTLFSNSTFPTLKGLKKKSPEGLGYIWHRMTIRGFCREGSLLETLKTFRDSLLLNCLTREPTLTQFVIYNPHKLKLITDLSQIEVYHTEKGRDFTGYSVCQ